MNAITKPAHLLSAQTDVWVYGLIIAGVALGIAVLIAFLIPWQSNRRCYIKRRIWFIVIGLVLPCCGWLYRTIAIAGNIKGKGLEIKYQETNLYVLLTSIALYAVIGIVLMFAFRNTKLGSILGKKKD